MQFITTIIPLRIIRITFLDNFPLRVLLFGGRTRSLLYLLTYSDWIQVTARLSDGGAPNQGRVELNVNGLWGTVADQEWDNKDGDVVCRMLGLPPASSTPRGALFGQGSGIVWLSHVDCSGNETSLRFCGNYGGWGTGDLYSSSAPSL